MCVRWSCYLVCFLEVGSILTSHPQNWRLLITPSCFTVALYRTTYGGKILQEVVSIACTVDLCSSRRFLF
ncbi:hypothetical protein ABFS82_04G030500 [Erythranthe guttata]